MATIGIDLGTKFSCVATFSRGKMEIIPNGVGKNTTPSAVAIKEGDEIIVGDRAVSEGILEPRNTIFDIKKIIGKRFNDPKIQDYSKIWPFQITELDGGAAVAVDGKNYLPKFVSTQIMLYLKEQAETFLNAEVKKAVITVPAYFSENQKSITRDACEDAGLEVLQLITEPTATAISYYCQMQKFEGERTCLIFDLGGGSLDIAFVTYKDRHIHILKIGGDPNLGGEDFDMAMVRYCIREFKKKHQIDLRSPQGLTTVEPEKVVRNLRLLKIECEKQKCFLSSGRRVVVRLDKIHGELDLVVPITREKFEELNESKFQRCVKLVKETLKECGHRIKEIDDIVLVGGSTRIPRVQHLLTQYFGKRLTQNINVDEAVAQGAAMQAHFLANADSRGAANFILVIEHLDFPTPEDDSQFQSNFPKDCKNCSEKVEKLQEEFDEAEDRLDYDNRILREDLDTAIEEISKLKEKMKMLFCHLGRSLKNIPSGLLSFENTEDYAVAVILKNSTSTHFLHPINWYFYDETREYSPMPPEIPPVSEHGFGFTDPNYLRGLFSFQIDETRFVARYGIGCESNSLGLAFLPPNYPVDEHLSNEIRDGADWSESSRKFKVYTMHWTSDGKKEEIDARLQFGNICAEATMTVAGKSVLNIEIKNFTK